MANVNRLQGPASSLSLTSQQVYSANLNPENENFWTGTALQQPVPGLQPTLQETAQQASAWGRGDAGVSQDAKLQPHLGASSLTGRTAGEAPRDRRRRIRLTAKEDCSGRAMKVRVLRASADSAWSALQGLQGPAGSPPPLFWRCGRTLPGTHRQLLRQPGSLSRSARLCLHCTAASQKPVCSMDTTSTSHTLSDLSTAVFRCRLCPEIRAYLSYTVTGSPSSHTR